MAYDFVENITLDLPDSIYTSFNESADLLMSTAETDSGLVIELASIHAGMTSNFTIYEEVELAKAIHTWVSPYPKPIIKNHDLAEEPLGRVIGAKMAYEADATPYIRLQVCITDYIAIQKVIDKRYITGSIGARADKAICTICGVDWANNDGSSRAISACNHAPGKIYDGSIAALRLGDISFKEYSFVNAPADQLSYVRSIGQDSSSVDAGWTKTPRCFLFSMSDNTAKEFSSEVVNKQFTMSESESEFLYQIMHFDNKNVVITDNINTNQIVPDLFNQESNMQKDVAAEQEDILEVTEKLTEDLSEVQDAVEEADSDVEEGTDEQESAVETEEESQEEIDSEVKATEEEATEEETIEEESIAEESDEADAKEDESSEEEIEGEEPEVSDAQESEDAELVVEDNEQQLASLKLENEALKTENAKLKSALHRTLAERVVDTKIALGIESFSARSSLIESHESRSASSLADSLRDLAKMPAPKKEAMVVAQLTIDQTSEAVDEPGAPIAESEDPGDVKVPVRNPEDVLVEKFSAVLLNKTELH